MNLLAASILLSTVLYLVDKNQQWHRFWKVAKWGGIGTFVVLAVFISYSRYLEHKASAARLDFSNYETPQRSSSSLTIEACATKIRRNYPSLAVGLGDAEIVSNVLAKVPGYCDHQ